MNKKYVGTYSKNGRLSQTKAITCLLQINQSFKGVSNTNK